MATKPDHVTRPVQIRIRTRRDAQRKIMILVGTMASIQILLDAADPFFDRYSVLWFRLAAAVLVGFGTVFFETFKVQRAAS